MATEPDSRARAVREVVEAVWWHHEDQYIFDHENHPDYFTHPGGHLILRPHMLAQIVETLGVLGISSEEVLVAVREWAAEPDHHENGPLREFYFDAWRQAIKPQQ